MGEKLKERLLGIWFVICFPFGLIWYQAMRAKELNHEITLDEYIRRAERSGADEWHFSVREYDISFVKRRPSDGAKEP